MSAFLAAWNLNPGLLVAIGMACALPACAALNLLCGIVASAPPGARRRRLAGASLALGTGLCVPPVLVLLALQHPATVAWEPVGLAVAWSLATVGSWAAIALGSAKRRPDGRPGHARRQRALSAFLMAVTLFAVNAAAISSARLPAAGAGGPQFGTDGFASPVALLSGPIMLSLLLLLAVLDGRFGDLLTRLRDRLRRTSHTDALTRLPNRLRFEQHLQRAVHRADRTQRRLALLFISLDGLKGVNESFGRGVGDALLRVMAQRLRALGGSSLLARAGGDEFLLLLEDDPDAAGATSCAARVLDGIARPCSIDQRDLLLSCSIGIAMYPEHGALSRLIPHAAAALNAARQLGGAGCCFFEAHMAAGKREEVELLRDLRRAIEQHELELYYQPKIHAPSGQITGAEALMRWHHPQRGMVNPGVFIPIAEHYGLINALGNWVIDDACRQIRAWRDQGLRMRVAINLSMHQLRQADLAARIGAALQRNRLEPRVLTCEITESVAMDDSPDTLKVIDQLAAIGVHLSIDDFGTGYSNLSCLRKLPAEEIKIDRGFVLDLETSGDARAIVDAVVKLAQAIGLKVVAEGVETEQQQQILRQLGCDELQGYLFAKPMAARALAHWAMNHEGPRALAFRESLFGETRAVDLV